MTVVGNSGNNKNRDSNRPVPMLREFERLFGEIVSDFRLWRMTGQNRFLNRASETTRTLDSILGNSGGGVIPIGIYSSGGHGFNVPPSEDVRAVQGYFPEAPLSGYFKLRPETAESAANAFWRLYYLSQEALNFRVPPEMKKNPNLEMFLRQAYVPTPDPIGGMPIIGPIPISDDVSVLFLSWVKGPTIHSQLEQFAELKSEQGAVMAGKFKDATLWTAARMVGVWQGTPQEDLGLDLEASVEGIRDYYVKNLQETLVNYSNRLAVKPLKTKELKEVGKVTKAIGEKLTIDPGNIVPYFDAALRNFIFNVGVIEGGITDVYDRTVRGRNVDYSRLWEETVRIDLSHIAKRPYALAEEDRAHITINWLAGLSQRDTTRLDAATVLTRTGIDAYHRGNTRKATEMAETLFALQNEKTTNPREIKEWVDYWDHYRTTITAMPWLRRLRQGSLALDYASKAVADQAAGSDDSSLSGVVADLIGGEAASYISSASSGFHDVINRLGLQKVPDLQRGIGIISNHLEEVAESARNKGINEEGMVVAGNKLLGSYT
jgi:hypothetical protein